MERLQISKTDIAIAGLAILTTSFGLKLMVDTDRQMQEDKKVCIEAGQIDQKGNRLDGFIEGRGCERFFPKQIIFYPYGMGGW
ncbi:MAG: hypothetical protein ACD_30C00081G0011 [uncultured bacterium]|uniref:Uncharacterized protein n=2 Tax=Candidatus Daviesiibacteriota TaxID=1752718 RepID=A0A0G0EUA0_9BACT|nr:MAG: hypothetical protein ACD_30C00081G0011 [uncultured bacterium]KKQ10488.1 MAG: hypothetical protein US19_C0004G0036 [Candidatus Daviesbacteria bacterium GW2011_GWB1_36_5]KKQ15669.1 MAG: hypothetical protein US28_C0012G0006 [Candidatus Daviesbacteria bacterium GW2011_GWA1_36_8]OGE32607.1 MAG: hypothetical protein A3C99_01935 [Candidatus Daviesbacteria bacterium RIFCSPHIGHO2_02_FULL_37_9]